MATHEIPFTRSDLLHQLTGGGTRLMDYFLKAVDGAKTGAEIVDGFEGTTQELFASMRENKGAHFMVPGYLFETYSACISTKPMQAITFMGVALVPWNREFIVAKLQPPAGH